MLKWKVTPRGGDTHVVLDGDINEATGFGELKQLRGRVLFDMEAVRRINSFGVRELVDFLIALGKSCTIEAERCSPAIVSQLNMLPILSSNMRVRSLIAPLECPECFSESEVMVEIPLGAKQVRMPKTPCKSCSKEMLLAEPEDRYFAFLSG
jgi:anti-anti-sigma regulatory factor